MSLAPMSGFELKTRRTRKRVFLSEMQQVVPWADLVAIIAPYAPTPGPKGGRPPFAVETMLRIHFLQQWYGLSDPAMEEALYDTAVMRRFAQLGGLDTVPDETTILNFRRLMETRGLAPKLLAKVNAHLSRKSLSLRSGTSWMPRSSRHQAQRRTRMASAILRCTRPRRATSGTSG